MIYSWMQNIIIYLMLASLVLNISPSGNYKKYISFFTGLIMILIVSRPVSFVFNVSNDGSIDALINDMDLFLKSNGSQDMDSMYDYYDMSIEKAISKYLFDNYIMVENVEVLTNKNNEVVKLSLYNVKIKYNENNENNKNNENNENNKNNENNDINYEPNIDNINLDEVNTNNIGTDDPDNNKDISNSSNLSNNSNTTSDNIDNEKYIKKIINNNFGINESRIVIYFEGD